MNAETSRIAKLKRTIPSRLSHYLKSEFHLPILERWNRGMQDERFDEQNITAFTRLEGQVDILIAFSFEPSLIETIFARYTEGMHLPEDQKEVFLTETAGDIINLIAGNCTADMRSDGIPSQLSVPIVFRQKEWITYCNDSNFHEVVLRTECGCVSILLMGPDEDLLKLLCR